MPSSDERLSAVERALANSPTLESAQAALRQANENTSAERGSYYPSVSGTYQGQRQKASGAAFGTQAGSFLYTLNSASVTRSSPNAMQPVWAGASSAVSRS